MNEGIKSVMMRLSIAIIISHIILSFATLQPNQTIKFTISNAK